MKNPGFLVICRHLLHKTVTSGKDAQLLRDKTKTPELPCRLHNKLSARCVTDLNSVSYFGFCYQARLVLTAYGGRFFLLPTPPENSRLLHIGIIGCGTVGSVRN